MTERTRIKRSRKKTSRTVINLFIIGLCTLGYVCRMVMAQSRVDALRGTAAALNQQAALAKDKIIERAEDEREKRLQAQINELTGRVKNLEERLDETRKLLFETVNGLPPGLVKRPDNSY